MGTGPLGAACRPDLILRGSCCEVYVRLEGEKCQSCLYPGPHTHWPWVLTPPISSVPGEGSERPARPSHLSGVHLPTLSISLLTHPLQPDNAQLPNRSLRDLGPQDRSQLGRGSLVPWVHVSACPPGTRWSRDHEGCCSQLGPTRERRLPGISQAVPHRHC